MSDDDKPTPPLGLPRPTPLALQALRDRAREVDRQLIELRGEVARLHSRLDTLEDREREQTRLLIEIHGRLKA